MGRRLIFSLICVCSGLMMIACERGVWADREGSDTYQPRPAVREETTPARIDDDAKGELMRIDMKDNTLTVRAENGMEQTFKFNDKTMVVGLDRSPVRNLMGKEGSEITVTWKDEAGAKTATHVNVNDLVVKKKPRAK